MRSREKEETICNALLTGSDTSRVALRDLVEPSRSCLTE